MDATDRTTRIRMMMAATLLLLLRRPRQRRFWVRHIYQRRPLCGEFHTLVQEMRLVDQESYYQYFRMTPTKFDELLGMVGPHIKRYSFRTPISEAERLAITIRYLATGDSQRSISFNYRVSQTAISEIIRETCEVLWEVLLPQYLKVPTIQEWRSIAEDFWTQWNFPNCVGALDGKHCKIQAPNNAGSDYFNYKKEHSIVLLAVCDANYIFTLVSIGDTGKHSDGGVLAASQFGKSLEDGSLRLPPPKILPGTQTRLPCVFVCDEAFPLRAYMMRPFPGKNQPKERAVFNYRLSRARRIIENTFGILVSKWRIFRRPIIACVETAEAVVKATVVLHNFLKHADVGERCAARRYCPPGYADHEDTNGNVHMGDWRNHATYNDAVGTLGHVGTNNRSQESSAIRERFVQFFNSPAGELPWQTAYVERGLH